MIMPDVNVLLYAHDQTSPRHDAARDWLESLLSDEQVCFSWHTITGFLRIITNSKIYKNPASLEQALAIVDRWMLLDNTHLLGLEKRNWQTFSNVLQEGQAVGNLVMDGHIAAVALAHGAKIASTDTDFSRFANVSSFNPLKK
jgi:uncharacterized protein